jgi:hypothetical protein
VRGIPLSVTFGDSSPSRASHKIGDSSLSRASHKNKEVRDEHGLLCFKLCLKLRDLLEEGCCGIGMCLYGYGREEIEREDTHNGLSVDDVSALDEVNLKIYEDNKVNKLSYLLNGKELNLHFLHW